MDTCRLRERAWRSTKPAADTDPVYQQALTSAGWRPWHTPGCPTANGSYTCWQRDELVLDLWTRDTPCDLASLPPVPVGGGPSASATPIATPIATPTGAEPPKTCAGSAGSLVTAKVVNRVDPNWHR